MPVAVEWSPQALTDLLAIRRYIRRDQPEAAERLAIRITALAEVLREYPRLGMTSGPRGLRHLPIGGTPYSIVYRAEPGRLRILAVPAASRIRAASAGSMPGTASDPSPCMRLLRRPTLGPRRARRC